MWCGAGIGAPLSCLRRLAGNAGRFAANGIGRSATRDLVALGVPALNGFGVGLDPGFSLADQLFRRCGKLVNDADLDGLRWGVARPLQQHLEQRIGDPEQPDGAHDATTAGQ